MSKDRYEINLYGGGGGKSQRLVSEICASNEFEVTFASTKENPVMLRLLADQGWYLSSYTFNNPSGLYYFKLRRIQNDIVESAINWWSTLSISQYLNQLKLNPKWMNKGETGIIHMYLNSLK